LQKTFWEERAVIARDVARTLAPALSAEGARWLCSERLHIPSRNDLRLEALSAAAVRLGTLGNVSEGLELLKKAKFDSAISDDIEALAPLLEKSFLAEARSLSATIENLYRRECTLAAICRRAAHLGVDAPFLPIALSVGEAQNRVLAVVAFVASSNDEVVKASLDCFLASLPEVPDGGRAGLVRDLVRTLMPVVWPPARIAKLVADLAARMSRSKREYLLPQVYALSPLAQSIGGPDVLAIMWDDIRQNFRWWP
jgi:hypothetical protein